MICLSGSPPHGRGKAFQARSEHSHDRITPRMGGEKTAAIQMLQHKIGSPPRGRGKGHDAKLLGRCIRITPAWAGKSRSAISAHSVGQDHPRVGEEKFEDVRNIVGQIGSSPRRRGKGGASSCAQWPDRITPAWAGKSHIDLLLSSTGEDHPRVGGEKQPFGTKSVEK